MTLQYGEIFAQRGMAYHNAMLRHGGARRAEFARLFDDAMPRPGQRVLDIPAGGGYLRGYLPADVDLVGLELSAGFGAGVPVYEPSQSWTHGQFDHVVCLAALHHIEDQRGFLRMLLTRLTADGTLHVADVVRGSGIARFLDGFIGRYNVTGHVGRYLPRDAAWFATIGQVLRISEPTCPWTFDDEAQMLDFCGGLFGLVDCPAALLRAALEDDVGVHRDGDKVVVDWQLMYVDLQSAGG